MSEVLEYVAKEENFLSVHAQRRRKVSLSERDTERQNEAGREREREKKKEREG